jgi:hypothetical protein
MERAVMDLFLPVLESAVVIAGHYAKGCGRDTVLAQDMCLGLMFAARNVTGKQIGSIFPEVYEDSESDSESEEEEDEEQEDPEWTRYEGDDETLMKVNECADSWDSWEPESPVEHALKNAVEKAKESYGGA